MKLVLEHHLAHPIDDVWAMLHDPESHASKFTGMGHRDLEIVSSEVTDTSIDLTIKRLVDMDVPSIAAKFIQPTNTVTSVDHWTYEGPTRLAGHYEVEIKGVPAETRGVTSVTADDDGAGCTYRIELEVKVKVPLIGEKVAKALSPQLTEQVEAEFAACDAWLAG